MTAAPGAPRPRECVERMAQAQAQASPRKQRAQTLRGAVEAIGEGSPHLVRRLMLKGRTLKDAIGLGKGYGTLGVAVAQVPEHAAADDGGQVDPFGEALTVLFIGQQIDWQRQSTAGQHGDQTLLTQGTDQSIHVAAHNYPSAGPQTRALVSPHWLQTRGTSGPQ